VLVKLESRGEINNTMVYLTPLLAVTLTFVSGFVLFAVLGQKPLEALYVFFVSPLTSVYGISELFVKATPIVLIAMGLSMAFKANVWNIGAEGQLTLGAITGGAMALAFYEVDSPFLLPAMMISGILGGMFWAAIPAFLKTRWNTNEILVTLMLTYVATLLLSILVHGPLRDPDGFNFPESRLFHDAAILPVVWDGTRLHLGAVITLFIVAAGWVMITRHIIGFQIRVTGMASRAAAYAGFREKRIIWFTLLLSGGLAGLAGMFEVSGTIGQLVPTVSPGYGFTAIIVAFLGRLHPIGILLAGCLMALTYLGGEAAQILLNMPSAVTGVFQGMLLFYLLACDVLIKYRLRLVRRATAKT
jgi:ABC-type uncharacterized transport system permease subunit